MSWQSNTLFFSNSECFITSPIPTCLLIFKRLVCYPYPLKVYDGQAKSDRRLIRPSLLYGRRECSLEVNKYSARGDTNAFLVLLSQNIFTQYNLKLGCKSVNKLQNYSSFYFSVCVTPRKTSHPLRISTENSCN